MNVEYAFLANAAEYSSDGKLYILGADYNVMYGRYPWTVPAMALVVKFSYPPEECGRTHRFTAEFWKPDGERMAPIVETELATHPISPPFQGGALTLVIALYTIVFSTAGVYTVRILLDGEEKKAFRLYMQEVPSAEQPPASPT